MQRYLFLGLVFLALFRAGPAQSGEINVLTDLLTPFPPGCVAFSLPEEPASADNTLIDEVIDVPSINSSTRDAEVRVTIWRVGCADEGYSAVMLRLEQVFGDNDVLIPQVFADVGFLDYPEELPFHQAQLIQFPAVGQVGATGDIISEDGTTFMLGVDNLAIDGATDFFPEDYNDAFTLELWWGDFSPSQVAEVFFIEEYVPSLDPPQFDEPVLHGRFNGQWVASGVPRTGLGLHIAETLSDENFVFAVFYTYLDGQPFWVTGNTLAGIPGAGQGGNGSIFHRRRRVLHLAWPAR